MAQDPICGMMVNEQKGIRLTHDGQAYFFCSAHCAERFKSEHNIANVESTSCETRRKSHFYQNKTFITAAVLIILIVLSWWLPILIPFRIAFISYVQRIWWAILLGLFLGGIIDYYIPREYVSHILASSRKRTILYSVILGFLMSVCSHGILAISIQLHKKGASNPAVVAFLLASPWANITITIMLIGFFGLKALFMICVALIIAITTGLIFQLLDKKGLIEKNPNTVEAYETFSMREDIEKRFEGYTFCRDTLMSDIKGIYRGALSLSDMVLWWILIGMGLASLAGAYVPPNIFQTYMGPTLFGLGVTLIVATLIEVCSEGSSPMAFEIFRQTGAFGNSFVFLMAGVATDYTEIGLLWHNVGRRVALWLPIIAVPQVILFGIIANKLF